MSIFLLTFALLAVTNAQPHGLGSDVTDTFPQSRIVGGNVTTIQLHPYQVSFQYNNNHKCGGSILNEHWVLTAGHCDIFDIKYVTIRAGSSYYNTGGSVHSVDKIVRHEKFYQNELGNAFNDLALVHVREPFVLDNSRQPIKLVAYGSEPTANTDTTVTGWGVMEGNVLSEQLRQVRLPIVNRLVCNEVYKPKQGGIGDGQICAGLYGIGKKDACMGDSGGPLVVNGQLAGMVSYGERCGDPFVPGVYVSIGYFRRWIDSHQKV